ncbi:MAG: hypothetical protein AB1847_14540 [bacterium]
MESSDKLPSTPLKRLMDHPLHGKWVTEKKLRLPIFFIPAYCSDKNEQPIQGAGFRDESAENQKDRRNGMIIVRY